MAYLKDVYVKPESDSTMEYDASSHRWRFTLAHITEGDPTIDPLSAARKARSYSNHVYEWLKEQIATFNWPFAEWAFACTADGKAAIKDAMQYQFDADSESNYDGQSRQSPNDFTTGSQMSQKAIRESIVCIDAQRSLENFMLDCGTIRFGFFKKFYLGVWVGGADRYASWGY